jgi:hypothetical protein
MDQPITPKSKPKTPDKKPKPSLNTKKTFKQIRSRTFMTIILVIGLIVYVHITMNRIERSQKDFQDRIALQLDSSNALLLEKVDSMRIEQSKSNKTILTAQKQSEQRIRNSIQSQSEK